MRKYRCSIADNVHFSEDEIDSLGRLVDIVHVFDNEIIPRTEDEIIQNIGAAEVAILDTLVSLSLKITKKCPYLKLIIRSGTSTEGLSQGLLHSRKLLIANIGDYASESTAEFVFAQILTLLRKVHVANQYSKMGGDDVYAIQGEQLAGKTIGIIGAGKVGSALLPIARGFGMNIRICTKNPGSNRAIKLRVEKFSSLREVMSEADIIVCCVRLDPSEYYGSKFLIGRRELQLMKEKASLISICDSLNAVDIGALYELILTKEISSTALDLNPLQLEGKFGAKGRGIAVLPNVLITSNIAFNTAEAIRQKNKATIDVVKRFVKGKEFNVLNNKVCK
ncbi:MAG: NAD(P)-dependent oxidoreductase [Candidatus Dojkabacteria bacterium]|jgi:D-3-phosphoglycerate dehydrogenase|nr:NAD(P)-dependent oxidoreductase [Candidatus Dojkabacteria bacterium]